MTHYRMGDSVPSAMVLSRNERTGSLDEPKIYNGNNIYLDDGTEFQIKLFNPTSNTIGATIGINGDTPNSKIILKGGEVLILDRFIDNQNKMVFETYNYDSNNESSSNAVKNNGKIEISFYNQYIQPSITYINTNLLNINSTTTSGTLGTYCSTTSDSVIRGNSFTDNNTSNSRGIDMSNMSFSDTNEMKLNETGKVELGEKSDQEFKTVQMDFEVFPFKTIDFSLKPTSQKTEIYTESTQYCGSCGYRKRNKSHLFCPKCGEKY